MSLRASATPAAVTRLVFPATSVLRIIAARSFIHASHSPFSLSSAASFRRVGLRPAAITRPDEEQDEKLLLLVGHGRSFCVLAENVESAFDDAVMKAPFRLVGPFKRWIGRNESKPRQAWRSPAGHAEAPELVVRPYGDCPVTRNKKAGLTPLPSRNRAQARPRRADSCHGD